MMCCFQICSFGFTKKWDDGSDPQWFAWPIFKEPTVPRWKVVAFQNGTLTVATGSRAHLNAWYVRLPNFFLIIFLWFLPDHRIIWFLPDISHMFHLFFQILMTPSSTNPDSSVASDDFTVYIVESPRHDRKNKENMLFLRYTSYIHNDHTSIPLETKQVICIYIYICIIIILCIYIYNPFPALAPH